MKIPGIVQAILLISLIPATAYAVAEAGTRKPCTQRCGFLHSLVTANGNATSIRMPNVENPPMNVSLPVTQEGSVIQMPTMSESTAASVSISAKVRALNETAVTAYDISGSSLTIGDKNYKLVNGTGIFNQHSLVVVIHTTVTLNGSTSMLILIGHADNALSTSGSVGVTFDSPQNKLAGKFFLSLSGILTLC